MSRNFLRILSRAAALFAALSFAALAFAQADDRAAAEATLKEVEGSPKKDVAKEMVGRARFALERGARMRSAGDESHAKIADAVARTWAEAARDVVRAAEVEERATTARRNATDAGAQAERERALLEEAIAQTGRVRAQLEAIERESKEQPARTSAVGGRTGTATDGGAAKPTPKPKPAPAAKDAGAK